MRKTMPCLRAQVSSALVVTAITVIGTLAAAPTASAGSAPGSDVLPGSQVGFAASTTPLFAGDAALQRGFDAMAATGAQWVRISFEWSSIEPDRGEYRWDLLDRAVDAAHARGLRILANPSYTPKWARAPGAESDKFPPANADDYAAFVAAAVERYAPRGIHQWEIWNEPNSVRFWKPRPDPAAYASLLAAAHREIVARDPDAVVLTGGTAPAGDRLDSFGSDGVSYSPYRWLRLLYQHGAASSFDAVGVHPYASFPRSPTNRYGNTLQVPAIHELMAANGDGAKQVWATEVGYPTGTAPGSVSEREQARFMRDYLIVWRRFSFAGPLFVYELRDRGRDRSDREDNFGLLRRDFSRKPAYDAFAAAVR